MQRLLALVSAILVAFSIATCPDPGSVRTELRSGGPGGVSDLEINRIPTHAM